MYRARFRWAICLAVSAAFGCNEGELGSGAGGSNAGGSGGAAGSGGEGAEPRPAYGPCDGFAVEVVEVAYGPGAGFGQDAMPEIVLGPPQGAGATQGSLDVVSLGNGGSITLGFGAQVIVDRPGPDFLVFENAFYAGGDPDAPFAEAATVEISADGETWLAFPCVAVEPPYDGCAGWHPVFANAESSEVDPHDADVAGGEAFDLADLGLTEARFVRIVDRADLDGFAGAFDLDAVALANFTCDAR